jgi:hypothetical protein
MTTGWNIVDTVEWLSMGAGKRHQHGHGPRRPTRTRAWKKGGESKWLDYRFCNTNGLIQMTKISRLCFLALTMGRTLQFLTTEMLQVPKKIHSSGKFYYSWIGEVATLGERAICR